MPKILVVTGSARKGRIADKVLAHVESELKTHGDVELTIADLKEIDLPFFNAEHVPMSPDFKNTDERVEKWAQLVSAADGVILLMPEYNHSMTAIQKNALDWLYAEWNDKPVSVVGYGWVGGTRAHITAKEVLGNLKAKQLPATTHLHFMKQIGVDGSAIDAPAITEQLKLTIDELLAAVAVPVTA